MSLSFFGGGFFTLLDSFRCGFLALFGSGLGLGCFSLLDSSFLSLDGSLNSRFLGLGTGLCFFDGVLGSFLCLFDSFFGCFMCGFLALFGSGFGLGCFSLLSSSFTLLSCFVSRFLGLGGN